MKKWLSVSLSALLLFLCACSTIGGGATPTPFPSPSPTASIAVEPENLNTLAERCSPGVVGIATIKLPDQAGGQALQGIGSGVAVHESGLILTNNHVVENSDVFNVVFSDGSFAPAELLWADPVLDLAIIRTQGNFTVLPMGETSTLRVGDTVIAIGTPLSLQFQHTVTQGIVSAKDRTLMLNSDAGESFFENLIQTDASINPGNSGGPLINMQGEVVGINTLKVTQAEGLGFAIPIDVAKPIIEHFIVEGSFITPYIGIYAYDKKIAIYYDKQLDVPEGVYLLNIDEAGPAYVAGLRKGDVIVGANGKPIKTMLDLRVQVYTLGVGRRISLTYIRKGQTLQAEMDIIQNPSR